MAAGAWPALSHVQLDDAPGITGVQASDIAAAASRGAREVLASSLPVGAPAGMEMPRLGGIGIFCGPMWTMSGITAGADGTIYIAGSAEGSVGIGNDGVPPPVPSPHVPPAPLTIAGPMTGMAQSAAISGAPEPPLPSPAQLAPSAVAKGSPMPGTAQS